MWSVCGVVAVERCYNMLQRLMGNTGYVTNACFFLPTLHSAQSRLSDRALVR